MRFASFCWRLGAAALLLGAAGCSTVSGGMGAIKSAVRPGSSGDARQRALRRRGRRRRCYEAPVNPTTQRAFDDASRALRSGRVDEAERAYKSLAQASPELGGPHANLGVIYRQARQAQRNRSPSSSRPSS